MKFAETIGYEPLRMILYGVNIYGLHAYGSLFSMNVSGNTSVFGIQARRVYAFKKYGRHLKTFVKLIEMMKEASHADMIIAIPSSKADKISSLQGAFGVALKRLEDSEQRKYNHSRPVQDEGKIQLLVDVKGKHVLLVDDIVTTGKSILFFRKLLLDAGASAVTALGIGVSLKAATDCPDAHLVDETFEKISMSLTEADEEVIIDEPEDSILLDVLRTESNRLQEKLGKTYMIEVSVQTAGKIRDMAHKHNLSENEVIRLAIEAFE